MANINDVAKLAKVSRGTVSNYLNGKKIRDASVEKIKDAIKKLHYVPNFTARELKTGVSKYVVFIIPTVWTPFFAEMTYYMQQALQKQNYKMIICNSHSEVNEEIEYLDMAKQQKVAGVITVSYSDIKDYLSDNLPLVSIEKEVGPQYPMVSSDNYQGGRLAARKLVEAGSHKLLFISKEHQHSYTGYRQKGFEQYCQDNQISYDVEIISHDEKNNFQNIQRIIQKRYQNGIEYDGIFTNIDEYAYDTWQILLDMGYQIPQEVQIVGFDGAKDYDEARRRLSSIRQPIEQIAKEAVEMLMQKINGKKWKNAPRIYLPISFIQGNTTKKSKIFFS